MTFDGGVVFFDVPCPDLSESVVLGVVELGVAVVGVSVVCGVLVVPVGVGESPDVPDVLEVPDVPDIPVVEPLPVDPDGDVVLSVLEGVPLPLTEELPVVDVDDGFDIELSVVGLSVLPQAPSAASVAAMAMNRIERCISCSSWLSDEGWAAPFRRRVGPTRKTLSVLSEGKRRSAEVVAS